METTFPNSHTFRPAPSHTSTSRQEVNWQRLSNDDLKFTFDLLCLHQSPYEYQAANEIERRIHLGVWLDIDKTPPPLAPDVPKWLKTWPFSLLWSQRPR